ncbi:hypothetical protein V2P20_10075 [Methylobacter sp. Wu1]|uniref:hypothetical protein n=1 Tax=Methylobacter sp. Wu1 TaxID=3119359 RepID=UPI002F950DD9
MMFFKPVTEPCLQAVSWNIVPVLPVGIYKIEIFAHAIAMLIDSRPFKVRYAGLERAPLFTITALIMAKKTYCAAGKAQERLFSTAVSCAVSFARIGTSARKERVVK